jgi:hypothetical protein
VGLDGDGVGFNGGTGEEQSGEWVLGKRSTSGRAPALTLNAWRRMICSGGKGEERERDKGLGLGMGGR